MKIRKILSVFLMLTLVISALGSVPVWAQTSDVGYHISSEENNGDFTLNVSLHGAHALSGKLAVSFDSTKLQLADTSSLINAVQASDGVVVTPEGLDASVLLSNTRGYAMFAWFSSSNAGIDATGNDIQIASIPFKLINGASTDDFSRNTIGLRYVNTTMIDKWECSAKIITYNLDVYKNNSKTDDKICNITYDYPNCDYVPPVIYETRINVTDYDNNPLNATVTLDKFSKETDAQGTAVFEMESGVYAYRINADGYETCSGYVIVENDVSVDIPLMSHYQIVRETADNLEIGYSGNDNESSVTTGLALIQQGENGETITWRSSNTKRIDNNGAVIRGDNDETVSLTATVSLGSASANKTFNLTVKSLLSAEEKNAVIVENDRAGLEIGYAPGDGPASVTSDLTLKEICPMGSYVMWSSSNEEVISPYGFVTRQGEDKTVTLTATVMLGTVYRTKEFTVTVKGENRLPEEEDKTVQIVTNSLKIGYADGDNASSVTKPISLPSVGANGTTIDWTSSNPSVVTSYGGVVRQASDCNVTLTATVTKGNTTKSKTFNITVKAAPAIPVNPDNGQESEIKDLNSGGTGVKLPNATAKPQATNEPQATALPSQTTAPAERFNDLGTVPWAKTAILTLADRGVISGTSDSTYSPQNPIRRADFVMLLTKLLELDGEITDGFDDVTADKYYYESVSRAKSLGIISGVGENSFNPEGSITRQDMMTMTYRALLELGKADFDKADLSRFKDASAISDYAVESVSSLVGAGYISGDDNGNVNPKANTTRAETAVFLYKLSN